MISSISVWDRHLRTIIPENAINLRPFTCNGFNDITVSNLLILGKEPATELNKNWWSFWSAKSGFDYDTFDRAYKEARAGDPSATRMHYNYLKSKGFKCIETNVYSNSTGNESTVDNKRVVQLLISNLPNLKGVIAHGNEAKKCLRDLHIPASVKTLEMYHFRYRVKCRTDAKIQAKLDRFSDSL